MTAKQIIKFLEMAGFMPESDVGRRESGQVLGRCPRGFKGRHDGHEC